MADQRITVMMRVDDTARADMAFTADRTYYRFATDSSIEDGELAPLRFDLHELVDAATPRADETPLDAELQFRLFVNNLQTMTGTTEQALRRLVDLLADNAAEFTFLRGFLC